MDQITETVDIRPTEICDRCGVPFIACQCSPPRIAGVRSAESRNEGRDEFWHPLENHPYLADRYRVLELIGKGGMGFVYKVHHEGLGRIFAMKVLSSSSIDRKVIKRFESEAKAIGAVHHPNLVSVHDFGTTSDGITYLVMEYLEGTSLDREVARLGHIPEADVIEIFLQVCEGLSCAHKKGIVHRDLKPNNIMLVKGDGDQTVAKIVDFGIAKRESVDTRLTQTGEVFGTPVYMSPEQCQAQLVDSRSDLYSLGCVMYEALSGKPPFVCENAIQTLFKHVNDDALPLRKACEGFTVSAAIEQLISRCLEKELKLRVQSADELATNLRRIKSGERLTQTHLLPRVKKRHVALASRWAIAVYVLILSAFLLYDLPNLIPAPAWKKKKSAAIAEMQKNHYLQAARCYEEAFAEAEKSNESVRDKVSLMRSVAMAYSRANDTTKVILWNQKLMGASRANHFSKDEEYAAWSLAQAIEVAAADEKEMTLIKDAISSIERITGKSSTILIKPLVKYGEITSRLEHYQDSAIALERALSIMDATEASSKETIAGQSAKSEPGRSNSARIASGEASNQSVDQDAEQSSSLQTSSPQTSSSQTPAEVLTIYETLISDYTHLKNFDRGEALYAKALTLAQSNKVSSQRLHHLQRFGERLHAAEKI
jgi:serine/threonine protein kinase